jgi:L-fuconolactonase
MRIIDAHVHTLATYKPMAPFEDTGRVDRLLHLMDDSGVEKAVMLPVVADFSPTNNEDCARWAAEHPDRLATMTNVALHEADAAAQILQAREKYGAVAISYYPNSADLNWMLESPCEPVWTAFATSNLVANLHITPPNYAVLLKLVRRYSQINFLCNHLALPLQHFEPDDSTYGGLAAGRDLPNLFIKASAFYAAAATPWDFRCPRALGFFSNLLEWLGPDRLLWGTDWPPTSNHLTYRQALELVRTFAEPLDDESLSLILGENAASLFGI